MNKTILGSIFLLISSILYSSMYISASIYASGETSKSKELFNIYLKYVGHGLMPIILVILIIGILLLVLAEYKK